MDEEIETLLVSVRADTSVFARDVAAMRAELDGPFAAGAARAGNVLEASLVRALRTGRLGFEDLKRVALSALAEIAAASIRSGLDGLFGGKGGGGGFGNAIASLVAAFAGAPGKAIGGPVSPGRAYLVGERGPELFVPTTSGRIEASAGGGREMRVSISINAPAGGEARALAAIEPAGGAGGEGGAAAGGGLNDGTLAGAGRSGARELVRETVRCALLVRRISAADDGVRCHDRAAQPPGRCGFLSEDDLAGLIWEAEDRWDHPLLRYETSRDFRNCRLAFRWRSGGVIALDGVNGPTLTVEGRDAEGEAATWYVRLWNYADGDA